MNQIDIKIIYIIITKYTLYITKVRFLITLQIFQYKLKYSHFMVEKLIKQNLISPSVGSLFTYDYLSPNKDLESVKISLFLQIKLKRYSCNTLQ